MEVFDAIKPDFENKILRKINQNFKSLLKEKS
jgi:hypothetical protein